MGTLALRECVYAACPVRDHRAKDAEADLVNGRDSPNHSDFDFDRSGSALGLQQRLGLRAERDSRDHSHHRDRSFTDWPPLIDISACLHGRRKREDRISQ
jgi:hypothetical protein